jgi:nucleotide-binding universal stress UspA family protein
MFKLLIAVDGSGHAHRAIDAVAKLAQSSVELEAVLLHVSPEPIFYGDYSANTIQSIQEGQLIRQNKVLKEATNYALARGLTISKSHRATGVIAHQILRVANDLAVDQIAMGTRGMDSVGNLFLGSVAQRVVHHASVPVLLVK